MSEGPATQHLDLISQLLLHTTQTGNPVPS